VHFVDTYELGIFFSVQVIDNSLHQKIIKIPYAILILSINVVHNHHQNKIHNCYVCRSMVSNGKKRVIIFLTKCHAILYMLMISFISQLLDKYDAIYLKRGVQFSYAYSMSIIYISLITCISFDTYHMIYKI
jgi:hypothetical protein